MKYIYIYWEPNLPVLFNKKLELIQLLFFPSEYINILRLNLKETWREIVWVHRPKYQNKNMSDSFFSELFFINKCATKCNLSSYILSINLYSFENVKLSVHI